MRKLLLVGSIIAALALGFFGTLPLLDRPSVPSTQLASNPVQVAAKSGLPPERCEVVFASSRCPAQRDFKDIDASGILYDNWQGSGSDQAKCLARAQQFHSWCGLTEPVTARFIRDNRLVAQARFPG